MHSEAEENTHTYMHMQLAGLHGVRETWYAAASLERHMSNAEEPNAGGSKHYKKRERLVEGTRAGVGCSSSSKKKEKEVERMNKEAHAGIERYTHTHTHTHEIYMYIHGETIKNTIEDESGHITGGERERVGSGAATSEGETRRST